MSNIVAYEVSSDSGDDASDSASEEEYIPPASRLPSLQPPAEEAENLSQQASTKGEHLESLEESCPIPNSANNTVPPNDRRETYTLKDNQLPQEMRVFLQAVEDFFTRSVNLERQKRAIKKSTFERFKNGQPVSSL